MGLIDSLQRGLGAIGGFAGDVFGQAIPTIAGGLLGQILPPFQLPGTVPGGGIGSPFPLETIGGFAGPVRLPARGLERALPQSIGVPFPTGGSQMAFLPGGAPIQQAGLGGAVLGGIIGGLGTEALGLFGSGGSNLPSLPGVAPGGIFRVTQPGLRARALFHITNPSTGNEVWYRNVGRPILFSGDLRTCKRVGKIARMAARSSRKR